MKKISKAKKIIIAVVLFVVLAAAGLVLAKKLLNSSKNEKVIYMVNRELYENVIEISGTIAAAQEQTLTSRSSGTVVSVPVKEGDHVKKGDIILQMDDFSEQYDLAKLEYDIATKKITGSSRELALLEIQKTSLINKIEERTVVATFDGIIADLDVAVGDFIEAKDSVGTIVNIDYLTAEVEVPETDVQKLSVGQKVLFTFPAYSKETIEGYVVGWPAIGEVTSRGATIVKAEVRIDEFPSEILPNFSFTGKIEISPTVENLVVSRYAVAYDENKQAYVELAKNGQKIEVEVERYGRENYKIVSGLKGGEELNQVTKPKASGSNKNRQNGGMPNGAPSGAPGGMPAGGRMPGGGMPGGMPGGF